MRHASILSLSCLVAALSLAGCASRPVQAPVIERAPPAAPRTAAKAPEQRPEAYVVKRGDTLYSIALDQGQDYKELAAWNNLDDPNRIQVGQQLRLKPPAAAPESGVTVNPVSSAGRVESRPLGAQAQGKEPAAARSAAGEGAVKTEPQARKLPYSSENVALLQRSEARTVPQPAPAAAPPAAAPAAAPPAKTDADVEDEDKVDWSWPARGKIRAGFSEASNKGIDISGKLGDPVLASAGGRVVYSGSGLRGYGKLVIIKHNKTYLSAYAHNKDILVKEGQNVVKGQKIAEVGNSDADAPGLHFEIRKLGKPVDPSKYLPPQ